MTEVHDLIIAGVCLVAVLFSDEFSDYTGFCGMSRSQWLQLPAQAVRWIGAIALAVLASRVWHR